MTEKEFILQSCTDILNSSMESTGRNVDNIFVFNKYQLSHIPTWVCEIISVCTGINSHLSVVIFDELMNSISARKFNNGVIPSNYIIVPSDWADCYEDGYPLVNVDSDLFDEYNTAYANLLTEVSREDLIEYVSFLADIQGTLKRLKPGLFIKSK